MNEMSAVHGVYGLRQHAAFVLLPGCSVDINARFTAGEQVAADE